jgi:hypothetical protein
MKIQYPQYTKQEKENSRKVNIFWKYEKLINDAKKAKANYLKCKSKSPLNLDDENRIALAELIVIFKKDALEYWNKAEELIIKNPFLNEMIRLKK